MNNSKEETNNKLILYRADYKGNVTKPEEFWKSGLWSKQINNGDPIANAKYGWIKTIKSHIKPFDEKEMFLYDTTTYLSFTTCDKKVIEYLKGKHNRDHQPSNSIKVANGYLFKITINRQDLVKMNTGIYLYKFKCNKKKYIHLTQEFEVPEICAVNFTSCPYCSNNPNFLHHILVVDCVDFLNNISESKINIKSSLKSAINDKEWLIMSIDPFEDGGTSSVIPTADFWDFKLYEYE
jgi:hypothetical protein